MSNFLKKHYVLALVIAFVIYKIFLKGWYMTATSYMYPPLNEPMVEQKWGRFSFTVPLATARGIFVAPFKIGTVSIEEIPYQNRARAYEEWNYLWNTIKTEQLEDIESDKKIGLDFILTGGFYDEDVSAQFGFPAHLLIFTGEATEHGINVYIQLPEYILHLREEILINEEEIFKEKKWLPDKLSNLLIFFKSYHNGKEENSEEAFYTHYGRIENIKNNREEYVGITYTEKYPDLNYNLTLSFTVLIFDYRGEDMSQNPEGSGMPELVKALNVQIDTLRHQQRVIGKKFKGRERIEMGGQGDNELFSASWTAYGPGLSADYPYMSIEMMCDPKIKDRALAIWDTMLDSFQHV